MTDTDVAVIGAGPNGLSVAAHLGALGVDRKVFGQTMGAWRFNMPTDMILKSEPYASDLSAPQSGFLAGDYCREAGETYHERVYPLSRKQFVDYGTWFAGKQVPDVDESKVVSLTRAGDGYEMVTDAGDMVRAKKVVVATGIIPFAFVPPELAHFGPDYVSHTSEYSDLSRFAGRRVIVLGGGQSALETAALLHEQGTEVKIVRRSNWIIWPEANPLTPNRLERMRKPVARLCEGWACWGYDRLPDAFRVLPERMRISRALGFLGPAGSWWLRERVEGKIPMLLGHGIAGVKRDGDGLKLDLSGPGGMVSEQADHVICGTGYRFDLQRLPFLDPSLRDNLRLVAGAPLLDRGFQSSVKGLYFTGALAAPSLGPLMRFVAGTHFVGPRVAARIKGVKVTAATPQMAGAGA